MLFTLSWFLLLVPGLSDLPVHCERHQVVGDWEFTLGALSHKRSSCGHAHPDNQNAQPALHAVSTAGPTQTMLLSLQDPSTAIANDGAQSGTWTMIYDEGFEVSIGDQVFFAFSYFDWATDAAGKKSNVSHCDATQVGWYHNAERTMWGCYIGKKVNGFPPAAPLSDNGLDAGDIAPAKPSLRASVQSPALPPRRRRASLLNSVEALERFLGTDEDNADVGSAAQTVAAAAMAPDAQKPWVPSSAGFDHPMVGSWQQSVADALNFLQLGWSAIAYRKFEGKTPRELNRFAGASHSRPKAQKRSARIHSLSCRVVLVLLGLGDTGAAGERSGVLRLARQGRQELVDAGCESGRLWKLLHDLHGSHADGPAPNLQARHKSAAVSVSFPLYCSEFNQGCDGGYGFLQSKWSEDVGLVPESCAPFSTGGGSCQALSECNLGATRFRAFNHHYVGGYYGGSDEANIKQELVENGPVVMSFEPTEDFMYYKDGVYRSGAQKIHQEWQQVDHAVLLMGYGSAQGQNYWTMQNSWGTDWGENGYFRMARGVDESGCESIVVAAEVIEEDSNPVLDDFLARFEQIALLAAACFCNPGQSRYGELLHAVAR
eukprot:CAMPEP_0176085440 /NCGR_PEP_ID=MMETSP0120_2-20121206/42761_1 /TAXON_ID=160619 /ORGANISM="Kryptoperidinium foliaceum, Strain CCMP 1326" /LENGTH=600 /DNA_ID=CAMNT_0017419255 /DNA_START=24 /DNA_END=1825 /DNA_ORIENTATION=+